MLESLLFMFLIFAGAFFAIVSFVILGLGLLTNDKKIYKIGAWSLSVPAICFGIIFIFYSVVRPWSNWEDMKYYSGEYILQNSNTKVVLVLSDNGDYQCDPIPNTSFSEKGTWKTGGIDGLFELREDGRSLHHLSHGIHPDHGARMISFSIQGKNVTFVQKD